MGVRNAYQDAQDQSARMEVVDMPEDELQVGSPVPVFKLPSTTGHEVGVMDYPGKKIVLFFVREYN